MVVTWQNLLDFFFPQLKRCPFCRDHLLETASPICQKCLKKIDFLPFLSNWEIGSLGIYSGVLKEAIHRLKYQYQEELAQPLGEMLAQHLQARLGEERVEGLVPLPLHENRLRKRGFNQAQLLSEIVGQRLGIIVLKNTLVRIKDTPSQVGLSKEERLKNLEDAFYVPNTGKIKGKNLILLDDVLTTGVTTLEAQKALLAGGAAKVKILTLARGKV